MSMSALTTRIYSAALDTVTKDTETYKVLQEIYTTSRCWKYGVALFVVCVLITQTMRQAIFLQLAIETGA